MKAFVISILAAALLALGVIAAACGGGDELTLEEYFEQAQVISDNSDEEFEALYADFPDEDDEEFFSNEENLPFLKNLFAGFPVIVRDTLDQVEELNPPAEAEEAHDEFLATGREWLELLEDGADRVEAVESISEAGQIEEELEPALGEAQQRFDDACLDLVRVGQANGIHVDRECADE